VTRDPPPDSVAGLRGLELRYEIVTPGGKQMRGEYTRHSFSYVVPAGEPGAGETVSINSSQ
jgi:hypothetical protein